MSYILPTILIVVSLIVIIFLIVKKFPQLVVLNINSIPELKEKKKKEELIKKRMENKATAFKDRWHLRWAPVVQELKEIQLSFRKYVGKVEKAVVKEEVKKKQQVGVEDKFEKALDLQTILQDAQYSFDHEDWTAAEKKFITAINIDHKNFDAYYGLGQVYLKQKMWKEAEETFKFLDQIYPDNSRVLNRLAELIEEKGQTEEAIEYYQRIVLLEDSKASVFFRIAELFKKINQGEAALEAIRQAVDIEPQNPKYLDFYLETSIMLGDKKRAEAVYQQLRMVNPENQKLVSFRERIEKL